MMKLPALILSAYLIAGFHTVIYSQQSNWTHFRGTHLNGVSEATDIPLKWNDSLNIKWKIKIGGKGWSSPVVYGDQIWLTSASENGKQMNGICVSLKTGKELFNIRLFEPVANLAKHEINTYATPTSCIEKDFAYFHFGTYGTACVKTSDGSVVWKRSDLNCDHVQGPASSPVLYKNLIILHLEGVDYQFIIALDKKTGMTVWKKDRPKDIYSKLEPIGRKAYITPIIINVKGKDLLISNGSAACIAYNPETGEEVWRVLQGVDSAISMPFYEDGVVYFYTGFVTPSGGEKYSELLAVNPDGKGDITSTNVLWRFKSPILQLLTPLIKDGLIYTVDSMNNLYCIDAKTGSAVYTKRLTAKYNSSPVFAAGKVFFVSVRGETLIINEGRKYEIAGKNKLNGEVYATPAITDNSIIIRSAGYLYCISTKK